MLYPLNKSIKFYIRRLWDTQKNIEAGENKALKKEERKEKIRKSNFSSIL